MFENTWHQWLRGLCKASLLKRVRNGRAVSSKPPRRRYVLELEALEARIVPAPVVGGAGNTVTYTEHGSSVFIDSSLTVTDSGSTTLASATVQVTGGFTGDGDHLAADGISNGTFDNINVFYNSTTETLTLTGSDTLAHYLFLLDQVSFTSSSDNPDNSGSNPSRTVTWQVNDGSTSSTPVTSTVNITIVDPDTRHWTGASGINSNWSTSGNWVENLAPGSGDNLVFDTTTTGFVGTAFAFAPNNDFSNSYMGITINDASSAGDFSITGNGFTLGAGGITSTVSTGSNATINLGTNKLTLGAAASLTCTTTSPLIISNAIDNGGFLLTFSGSGNSTISGVISNTGGLTMCGTGTLTLSSPNTYTGATTISAGTLADGIANALPTGTALTDNGTLDLAGFSQQVASITGSGVVTDSGAAATFTVNNGSADTYGGTLTGTNLALTKTGTGALTLSGTNSYGGNTTLSAGTLLYNGTDSSSQLNLNGGTFTGSGTVKNIIATGGTADPGTVGGIGTLTLAGTTASTLAGAAFQVDLGSAGTSDLLQNNANTLTLTGASLQVSATSTSTAGQTFTIINSAGGLSGTFTGLADGTVVTGSNGRTYVIHYTATTVTLTDIPVESIVVTTNGDGSGTLSTSGGITYDTTLRGAITAIASGGTISFQSGGLAGGNTISLNSGLTIDKSLTITGPTDSSIIIDGGGAVRPFFINGAFTFTVSNLQLSNGSGNFGGAISMGSSSSTLIASNCTFSGNTATTNNGGAISSPGISTISNSTFYGNTASFGGAISASGTATVTNSTFAGNTATSSSGGGAIYVNTGTVTLKNCLLGDNTANSVADDLDRNGGTLTVNYSLVENPGNSGVTNGVNGNITGKDPKLTTLGFFGGPTETMGLLPGSPAIDAGSNTLASGLSTDQRGTGYARVVNTTVDIGAFEIQNGPASFIVTNLNDSGSGSLRQAVLDSDTTIGANTITFQSGLSGIIYLTTGQLDLSRSVTITGPGATTITVSGNNASRVFLVDTGVTATISGLTISQGSSSTDGGAIENGGTLTLQNSTLSGNKATFKGGAIWNYQGTLKLQNSTLSGTNTAIYGGAIYNQAGSVTMQNTTVTGNSANYGGGLYSSGGTVNLQNCTVAANSSPSPAGSGGGILIGAGTLNLTNAIVAGNTVNGAANDVANASGTANASHSLIQNSSGTITDNGGNIFGQAAQLGSLQDNGGPTQTMALLAGSPCIDAGSDSGASGLTTDQRGAARIYGSHVDIGAYEYIGSIVVTSTADGSGTLSTSGGVTYDTTLRGAILYVGTGGTITFQSGVTGTITLTGPELDITNSMTITGPGASTLTVSGNNASRVFSINSGVTASISGLTIANGKVGKGAGILNGGTLILQNSTLSGNSATASGGGGIYNSGTLTLQNSTLSGNSAPGPGGGIDNYKGTLSLQNCTLWGNTAGVFGGGIENDQGAATVLNTSLAGNAASSGTGGGIDNFNGTLTLVNSILSGNTANSAANDIYHNAGAGGTVNATNCLFSTTPSTGSGNTINGTNTANLFGTNPLLGSLQYNGGTTQTMALSAGSPAIDAGTDVTATVTTDQRGVAREIGSKVDIGAYEYIPSIVVTTTADGAGTLTSTNGSSTVTDTTLRGAILYVGPGGTITFQSGVTPTITLGGTELDINNSMTIAGPGASTLTVSGNNASTVLHVNTGVTVSISGVTIANGKLTGRQGGDIRNDGTLTLQTCTVSAGSAKSGGGIFNDGLLAVQNSTISGNSATFGGGLYSVGTLTMQESTVSGNVAVDGGGLYSYVGTITLQNSTLFGNSASFGGGINNEGAAMTLLNCTISGNSGTSSGGGVFQGGGPVSLNNTIVANSTSGGDLTGTFSGTNDLIGDGSGSGLTSPLTGNPMLGSLANNSGPTQTMALLAGSPCIDAGDSSAATLAGLTYDQRGAAFLRIFGGAVDIGAYEYQGDFFNRTNANPVSGTWQIPTLPAKFQFTYRRRLGFGGFQLQSDQAVSLGAAPFTAEQVTGLSPQDVTLQASVDSSNALALAVGLMARLQGNGDCYAAILTNSGQAEIVLFHANSNSFTVLKSASAGGNTGTMTFTVSGNTLSLVCGAANINGTDSTLTSTGGVGLFAWGVNGIIDNFSVNGG
jgi:autotransporter-associated beta strand protein